MLFRKLRKDRRHPSNAFKTWVPTRVELKALEKHSYLNSFGRVDQIWQWLKETYGHITAVDAPHSFHPETFNYFQLSELISTAAAAFQHLGIQQGDVVALFSENSPRWLIADQGIMRVGASDAVRGSSAPSGELKYILEDSQANALVVQNAELLDKLSFSDEEKKNFKIIVQLEGEPEVGVLGWDEFLKKGSGKKTPDIFEGRSLDSSSTTVATILYTSGTTGKPKGVPLTHANLLHQMRYLVCVASPDPGDPVLSVLPIWHSYERSAEYYFFSCACTQSYTTIKHFKNDLPRVKPIVMATVPRLWEAIKIGFDDAIQKMPPVKKSIIKTAIKNSSSFKLASRDFRNLKIEKNSFQKRCLSVLEVTLRWPIHTLSSLLLWPKVLDQLCGGRLAFPISGGGAIAPHVDSFFESVGIDLLVGYGLTETSPVISCRRPWRNIRGSAGQPLPETEFKIVDQSTREIKLIGQKGLVMVRGNQVMSGYLGKEESTKNVLTNDGWFDTGDIGMLLDDGSVVLTGRYKDTIVLSNGENIEPGPLEELLVSSPLIEQVVVVGQDERQLGALIVPRNQEIVLWAKQKGLIVSDDLGGSPGNMDLRKLLRREINTILSSRKGFRSDERVFSIALVQPFTLENGLLTQTLKQRRQKIFERDADIIDSMF